MSKKPPATSAAPEDHGHAERPPSPVDKQIGVTVGGATAYGGNFEAHFHKGATAEELRPVIEEALRKDRESAISQLAELGRKISHLQSRLSNSEEELSKREEEGVNSLRQVRNLTAKNESLEKRVKVVEDLNRQVDEFELLREEREQLESDALKAKEEARKAIQKEHESDHAKWKCQVKEVKRSHALQKTKIADLTIRVEQLETENKTHKDEIARLNIKIVSLKNVAERKQEGSAGAASQICEEDKQRIRQCQQGITKCDKELENYTESRINKLRQLRTKSQEVLAVWSKEDLQYEPAERHAKEAKSNLDAALAEKHRLEGERQGYQNEINNIESGVRYGSFSSSGGMTSGDERSRLNSTSSEAMSSSTVATSVLSIPGDPRAGASCPHCGRPWKFP